MPALPASSAAYRIRQGETIVLQAWANAVGNVGAIFRVVYDDGSEQDFPIANVPTTSNRVIVGATSKVTAKAAGYVVSGTVYHAPSSSGGAVFTDRGSCYARACIASSPSQVDTFALLGGQCRGDLATGYVYRGHDLCLGQLVEPGPTGGHGQMAGQILGDPIAGADYAPLGVPTGAIWKIRGFFGQLVTGAAAANREFSIQYQDAGGNITGGGVADEVQTATLTDDYLGILGPTSSGVSTSLTGGVVQIGLPDVILFGTSAVVKFVTYNLQALDNWGAGRLYVEEWVMPN